MLRRKPTRVELTLGDTEVILKNFEKEKSKYEVTTSDVKPDIMDTSDTKIHKSKAEAAKQRVGYLPFSSQKDRDSVRWFSCKVVIMMYCMNFVTAVCSFWFALSVFVDFVYNPKIYDYTS